MGAAFTGTCDPCLHLGSKGPALDHGHYHQSLLLCLLSGCLTLYQLIPCVCKRVSPCLQVILRYIGQWMQVKGGVRITQEVQEICTVLNVLLVESGVGLMIYHLLLGVQPPDLDHLAS